MACLAAQYQLTNFNSPSMVTNKLSPSPPSAPFPSFFSLCLLHFFINFVLPHYAWFFLHLLPELQKVTGRLPDKKIDPNESQKGNMKIDQKSIQKVKLWIMAFYI